MWTRHEFVLAVSEARLMMSCMSFLSALLTTAFEPRSNVFSKLILTWHFLVIHSTSLSWLDFHRVLIGTQAAGCCITLFSSPYYYLVVTICIVFTIWTCIVESCCVKRNGSNWPNGACKSGSSILNNQDTQIKWTNKVTTARQLPTSRGSHRSHVRNTCHHTSVHRVRKVDLMRTRVCWLLWHVMWDATQACTLNSLISTSSLHPNSPAHSLVICWSESSQIRKTTRHIEKLATKQMSWRVASVHPMPVWVFSMHGYACGVNLIRIYKERALLIFFMDVVGKAAENLHLVYWHLWKMWMVKHQRDAVTWIIDCQHK